MKIVNIFGGLGNQMFQYALMVALQKKYNEEVLADIHYMDSYTRHNGIELEKVFPITLKVATKDKIKKLSFYTSTYNSHKYLKWLHIRKPSTIVEVLSKPYHDDVFIDAERYYDGYWQDPRYFTDIKEQLLSDFTFKSPLNAKNQEIYDAISTGHSVGIHIRRGDYMKKARYRGICDVEYYTQAINKVKELVHHPHFYFFSNDVEWSKTHLLPLIAGEEYTFIDWNKGTDSYIDMQLMSCCKSLIIANSSFSWWAAYLNRRSPIVIAPKQWFNCKPSLQLQLDDWLLI